MKARDLFSKVLSFALVAVMLLGMLPTFASAAETDPEPLAESDGLVTSKTVTIEENGTYTIRLEAYATGTVTTNKTTAPTDIVLVLDDSGSMDYCITCGKTNVSSNSTHTLYTYTPVYDISTSGTYYYNQKGDQARYCSTCRGWFTTRHRYSHGGEQLTPKTSADSEGTQFYTRTNAGTESCTKRITALQNAAKLFIYETYQKNLALGETDPKHRISVVTFAGSGSTKVTLSEVTGTASKSEAGVVTATAGNVKTLIDSINAMNSNGATNAEDGLAHAVSEFNKVDYTAEANKNRQKIVIFFTDGLPTTESAFSYEVASGAINNANTLKGDKYNASVYSISVLSDADVQETSGKDTSADDTAKMNTYMNAVSSNYPDATATGEDGGIFTSASYSVTLGDGSPSKGFYKKATSSSELTSIFQEISNSVGSSSIDLGSTAVMSDIIASSFTLPSDFGDADSATVKVYTADHLGDYKFGEEVLQDAQIVVNGNTKAEGAEDGIKVNVTGKTVDITGFSYKDNFCVNASADGTVSTKGKKIIVEITGVEVDPENFISGEVLTNDPAAGIYENGEKVTVIENFTECKVKLNNKSYVLDYAKPFQMAISEWGLTEVLHLAKDTKAIESRYVGGLDLEYGSLDANYVYTPKTMLWDGFDTFYAFGDNATEENPDYTPLWSRINVIPADNVYYEDDFVNSEDEGTVGIEYGGNWTVDYTDENSNNGEDVNEGGWLNGDLADDAGYTDGSAHKMENLATATFTFTGTGVDIYSYTDMTTGAVRAILYDGNGEIEQYFIVDNLAETGEYYQIPTLTFQDLTYGTYTIELKVMQVNGTKRATYYLDGIRVYNPLGIGANDPVNDKVVDDAYGDEQNACFTEVRDILIDAATFSMDAANAGAVFIENPYKNDGTDAGLTLEDSAANVGTFEDYGPKNEVYLAAGQSIVFQVDPSADYNYYVGLKAPEGATVAKITNGADVSDISIAHSSDLFYEITPNADGYIMIRNNSENMLAITKLRTTNAKLDAPASGVVGADSQALLAYAASFSRLNSVDYAASLPGVDVDIQNPVGTNTMEQTSKTFDKILDTFRSWFDC